MPTARPYENNIAKKATTTLCLTSQKINPESDYDLIDRLVNIIIAACTLLPAFASCSNGNARTTSPDNAFTERGAFSADSAYEYVAKQVAFGPRVPGSDAHTMCAEWIIDKLHEFGADTVYYAGHETEIPGGSQRLVRNIIAQMGPADINTKRILLIAHYDTRPRADQDSDPEMHDRPFDGANDGASGVGVILEIARNLAIEQPNVSVDILLTDLEDSGENGDDASWCVGAQQFADDLGMPGSLHRASDYRWGILLDMVGGKDARFPQEYFSKQYVPVATAKMWNMAGKMGLRHRFPTILGGAITDDHLPLIRAGIPTVDIIESANPATGSFPPTWHTMSDNLENIDPTTLSDVGRVVLNVIYNEK